jgi:circadian clock protein KaiC
MEKTVSWITGLDGILKGGFCKPSAVLIAGPAGTGKTTFAMQSIFLAEKQGEVCMYVTSDTESSTLVQNFLPGMSFYNVSLMSKGNIHQVPIGTEALDRGIYSFMWNLEDSIEKIRPDRIVIDPINALGYAFDIDTRRRFYCDLFQRMKKWGALVLITAEVTEEELLGSDLGHVVDGIIHLSNDQAGFRRTRHLEILKMRGQEYIPGKHLFSITSDGITVLPRGREAKRKGGGNTPSGIAGLDEMLAGGIPAGTSTCLCGQAGAGKTVFGLQYICAGATAGEKGIFVGFAENPAELEGIASRTGMEIGSLIKTRDVKLITENACSLNMPRHVATLEETIEETGAVRVFIDDMEGYLEALGEEEGIQYIRCLTNTLKNAGVTPVFSYTGKGIAMTEEAASGKRFLMDNLITLRYAGGEDGLKRGIVIQKLASGAHEGRCREFNITDKGVTVGKIIPPGSFFSLYRNY